MQSSVRITGFVGLAVAAIISSQPAFPQKNGGPSPIGGNAGTGRIPPNLNGQATGPVSGGINGSIYLSGNVLLDDGTPPPEPVTIERVCSGAPRAQAYTDHKGRFSFQVGHTAGVIQDASEEGSSGMVAANQAASMGTGIGVQLPQNTPAAAPNMELANCDLRAVLAGFRSDTVSLGARRTLDDPNVGTIILHRLAGVEGSAVSVTSLQAPKDARQAYNRGLQYIRKEKFAEAKKSLTKAVEIYPKYAAAWFELGRLQGRNGDPGLARQSFSQAIAADPKYLSPYFELAGVAAAAENWQELAATTNSLLKLDAVDYPMAYFYNTTANLNLNNLDEAEKAARAGEKLDVSHRYPKLYQVLATILARERNYAAAVNQLRTYLLLAPDASDAPEMKKQLTELERLSGSNEQAKAATDPR